MELFLTTHALRSDFPYIKRDFKLDDQLMLYVNHSNNCQGVHGITCTLGFEPKVYEIPMHVLAFHYQGSDYGILVTEQYIAQTFWYCASLPFDRLQLLHILQNQSSNALSCDLQQTTILKVIIENNQIAFDYIKLLDIQALF
ncbi:MAG: hypothetical protein ACK46S_06815 [Bacteroidota bacterium]